MMYSIMMYSKNLFEMLSSMTENKRSTKSNRHFSPENSLCNKWVIRIKLPQIYAIPNLTIHSINICEMSTSILGVQ